MVPAGITSTTDVGTEAGLNALIYGPPGAGKTALATSIVEHESVVKALHIDIDGSPKTLIPHPKLDRAEIPSGRLGWDKIEEVAAFLHGSSHDYNTVIADTVTTLGAYGLDSVLHENFLRTKRSDKARMAFPSMGDYGINNRRVLRMVRFLREFSISRGWHVILVCHEKEVKLESGALAYRPSLSGQLADVIPGIPDVVGRVVEHKPGQRYIQVENGDGVLGKHRLPSDVKRTLPGKIQIRTATDPTGPGMNLADIWSAMLTERTAA